MVFLISRERGLSELGGLARASAAAQSGVVARASATEERTAEAL